MAEALNGGAAILSYEVSLYHKATQKWISIAGGLNDFSLLTETIYSDAVNQGETYQVRYRAWNINGAGEWSLDGYILAA